MCNCETKLTEQEFSNALLQALTARFGRVPSARKVADELFAFSAGEVSVTGEAVRKWMRSQAMPRGKTLLWLESWLGAGTFTSTLHSNLAAERKPANQYGVSEPKPAQGTWSKDRPIG